MLRRLSEIKHSLSRSSFVEDLSDNVADSIGTKFYTWNERIKR